MTKVTRHLATFFALAVSVTPSACDRMSQVPEGAVLEVVYGNGTVSYKQRGFDQLVDGKGEVRVRVLRPTGEVLLDIETSSVQEAYAELAQRAALARSALPSPGMDPSTLEAMDSTKRAALLEEIDRARSIIEEARRRSQEERGKNRTGRQ